jgi:hypothetical protein
LIVGGFGSTGFNIEPSYLITTYATGYGEISYSYLDAVLQIDHEQHDTYAYKDSMACINNFIPILLPTGIKNIQSINNTILIFPNPANNELTINTTITLPYTITIHNIIGQEIYSLHTSQQQQTINTSELPAGLYNVTITDESGYRYNNKIVITH